MIKARQTDEAIANELQALKALALRNNVWTAAMEARDGMTGEPAADEGSPRDGWAELVVDYSPRTS